MSSNLFICHWNIFDWKIFEICSFYGFYEFEVVIWVVPSIVYYNYGKILSWFWHNSDTVSRSSLVYQHGGTHYTDPTFWRNCSFMILNEILRRIIHCCRIRQSNNNFYVVPPSIQQVDTENQERDSRHHPLLDRDNDVRPLISTFSVWILLCILSIPKIIFVLWPLDTNLQNLLCGI